LRGLNVQRLDLGQLPDAVPLALGGEAVGRVYWSRRPARNWR
jgi:hypothetical protein